MNYENCFHNICIKRKLMITLEHSKKANHGTSFTRCLWPPVIRFHLGSMSYARCFYSAFKLRNLVDWAKHVSLHIVDAFRWIHPSNDLNLFKAFSLLKLLKHDFYVSLRFYSKFAFSLFSSLTESTVANLFKVVPSSHDINQRRYSIFQSECNALLCTYNSIFMSPELSSCLAICKLTMWSQKYSNNVKVAEEFRDRHEGRRWTAN